MMRFVSFVALVVGLTIGGFWGASTVLTYAQTDETVCVPPATPVVEEEPIVSEQRLLGRADYAELPAAPARMTTTQIILAPGSSTQPFVSSGPTLIVVQEGTVTLTADQAVIGAPPDPSPGGIAIETAPIEPAPADEVGVTDGEQISIASDINVQLENGTEAEVRLLVIALTPGETS